MRYITILHLQVPVAIVLVLKLPGRVKVDKPKDNENLEKVEDENQNDSVKEKLEEVHENGCINEKIETAAAKSESNLTKVE